MNEKDELIRAWQILKKLSGSEIPVVRFNSRRAKNELWQALYELDMLSEEELFGD